MDETITVTESVLSVQLPTKTATLMTISASELGLGRPWDFFLHLL